MTLSHTHVSFSPFLEKLHTFIHELKPWYAKNLVGPFFDNLRTITIAPKNILESLRAQL